MFELEQVYIQLLNKRKIYSMIIFFRLFHVDSKNCIIKTKFKAKNSWISSG